MYSVWRLSQAPRLAGFASGTSATANGAGWLASQLSIAGIWTRYAAVLNGAAANSTTSSPPRIVASTAYAFGARSAVSRWNPNPASTARPSSASTKKRDGTWMKLSPGSQYTSGHSP